MSIIKRVCATGSRSSRLSKGISNSLLPLALFTTMCSVTCCGALANSPIVPPQICVVAQSDNSDNTENKKGFSGNVSWYGPGFQGKKTASGEIFDMHKLTAAHLTLPLGTRVLVEDPKTGKSVIVKVNDRGPYVHTRVMDLAKEGGRRLDLLTRGVAYVNCLIID